MFDHEPDNAHAGPLTSGFSGENGPITNGVSGRSRLTGRFEKGNRLSVGRTNAHAAKVQRLRAAFLDCVTEQDVWDITRKLIEMAKGGSIPAIKELNDRIFGKPAMAVDMLGGGLFDSYEQRLLLVREIITVDGDEDAGEQRGEEGSDH